jgi:membrane-associated protein
MLSLVHFIKVYGYVGLFGITFLESSFFFPLPGDSLLFTAGIFATHHFFNVHMLVLVFFSATFLGSLFGYWIGENLHKLNTRPWFKRFVSEEHLQRVHVFYKKYGIVAILFSRFVPIVRTFAPIGAGVGAMRYRDFIKYNIAGAVLWSTVVTYAGYFLGKTFPHIQDYISVMVLLIIVISVLPGIVHLKSRSK